ncbi:MAG: WGR domain-containing protein [Deltaproteobacteria bacterium]|nr:WGR domain-containing protein [Deltaproteobacteria bacterium]
MPDYYVELEKRTNGPTGGKFWIVEVYGAKVVLKWGPVNKSGTFKEKQFGTPAAAMKYAARRENEQLSEGYRNVGRNRPQKSAINVAAKMAPLPQQAPEPTVGITTSHALVWDF